MSIQSLVEILVHACQSQKKRPQLIAEFQNVVWNMPEDDSWQSEILGDLAYDLEFYQPDAVLRAEDKSYIDDEQVVLEIKSALEKLQKAGQAVKTVSD